MNEIIYAKRYCCGVLIAVTCMVVASSVYAPLPKGVLQQFKNYYFVETGTCSGDGVQRALEAKFEEIHSIDIDKNCAKKAYSMFSSNKNVHLWQGDSGVALWDIIKDINEPITFWLDAHNSTSTPLPRGRNTPLLRELEQIRRHPIKNHTILIDDMRCCGTFSLDFISREEICKKLFEINPSFEIFYIDGDECGEPKMIPHKDILVARVRN